MMANAHVAGVSDLDFKIDSDWFKYYLTSSFEKLIVTKLKKIIMIQNNSYNNNNNKVWR